MRDQDVKFIIVHCAATPPKLDIGAKEIGAWHRAKGWAGCGYHAVIRRDGTLEGAEEGCRPTNMLGAHCLGYNARSIGVCLVGGVDDNNQPENNFTPEQMNTLARLLDDLGKRYPQAEVRGHRDMPNVHKDCPSFDVAAWLDERAQAQEVGTA